MKSLPISWGANHRFTSTCPFLWELPRGLGEIGPWAAKFSQWCFGSGLYQAELPSAGQGWWHKHFTTTFKYDSFTKNLSREDAHANILWRLWLSVKKPVVLSSKMLNTFCIIFFFSQQNRSKLLQRGKTFISMKKRGEHLHEWNFRS